MAYERDRARAADLWRNLLFYPAFYLGSVFFVLAAIVCLPVGSAFRWVVEGWSHWHRWCVVRLLGIKVRIEGLPPPPGSLVVLKHESFFEAIDLPGLLDHPVVFAKAELMNIPLWGLVGRRYGLVAVRRDEGAKALRGMITAAREQAGEHRPLAIFAEGRRIPHGQAPELQAGFVGLYKLLGRAVVPVAVNSGPLYHRRWKRPGTITIRFGEQIPAGLPREEIELRVRAAINALNVSSA